MTNLIFPLYFIDTFAFSKTKLNISISIIGNNIKAIKPKFNFGLIYFHYIVS